MSIRIQQQNILTARVEFPYDEEAVAIIKTIGGKRWDKVLRYWTIPADSVQLAARRFTNAGFTVTINGTPYTPTSTTPVNSSTVIRALFTTLPQPLRSPAFKALAKVMHPDVGGNTALMQQLTDAYQETR